MSAALPLSAPVSERRGVIAASPDALTAIYDETVNLAVWQRQLENKVTLAVEELLGQGLSSRSWMMSVASVADVLNTDLPDTPHRSVLAEDVALVAEAFGLLFDLQEIGVRLTVLDKAMCPRFHVDHVPCRLVTTYAGKATEWLPHEQIDRSKLGAGSNGLADEESGLFKSTDLVQQLNAGDVALLKGERWEGNEGAGCVHRSPMLPDTEQRLLLTIDFAG